MRPFFLLFYFLTLHISTCAQIKQQNKSTNASLENLFERVSSISKNEKDLYAESLKAYLEKAKEVENTDHLFNAYLLYVYNEKNSETMHMYADSLIYYAKKTGIPLNIIKANQTRSTIYYIQKNYKKSLEYELAILQSIDKIKYAYEYHKTIYNIGLTYFYLQQYQEAFNYFALARAYFEGSADYNHIMGYHNSARYEALAACYLNKHQFSIELISVARKKLSAIRKEDRALEQAYLDYVYGINLYHLKKFKYSIEILNNTITEISKNEDYANEHNAYYYLGLNYWALNEKEDAVKYFDKIDEIFKTKHYSNLEIKNAYNYLTAYYRSLKNEQRELYYTNQFLKVTVFLQNEYKYLNNTLHKQLDIKHLESEKKRLEDSLKIKDIWFKTAFVAGSVVCIIFLLLLISNYRKKKEYLRRYNELSILRKNLRSEEKPLEILSEPATVYLPIPKTAETETTHSNDLKEKTSEKKTEKGINAASIKTLDEILIHLDSFEENLTFLNSDINLNQLATLWNTNRSYLSTLINQYKGKSFTDYVNQLRIDYLLKNFEENPQWKKYKIAHLSELLGFSSSRSFSNAFLKATGISPSFYIQKLKSEDSED